MQVFGESGLELAFGPEWIVRRYDAHPFYRLLSGHGYRGVDFVLLHRSEPRAVWIEVKNYTLRYRGETPRSLPGYIRRPALLAEVLAGKAGDTRRGLLQIDRHYRSRWWWRLWGGLQFRFALAAKHGWQQRLRERDAVFFPLLLQFSDFTRTAKFTYTVRVELEAAYADIPNFDATDFRESLARNLAALGFPATIELNAT